MSNSDKHCTYLDDPDDLDLNKELDGFDKDEIQELKRGCVTIRAFFVFLG